MRAAERKSKFGLNVRRTKSNLDTGIMNNNNNPNFKRRNSNATYRGMFANVAGHDKLNEDHKKENNTTKYFEIDSLKKRITHLHNDIEKLKDSYNNLPKELEEYIDDEIDSEMKIFLEKSFSTGSQ